MRHVDAAALSLLTAVTEAVAKIEGPIPARVGSGILHTVSSVVRERQVPISTAVLEAMMGLVGALRDDITA